MLPDASSLTDGAITIDAGETDLGTPLPTPCQDPSQCPAPSSHCRVAACTANLCSSSPLPAGPAPKQITADCRRIDCTASGDESIVVDDTDFNDGNECTEDRCAGGVPTHKITTGAPCGGGQMHCDATGTCVACTKDSECPMTSTNQCYQPACLSARCTVRPSPLGALCNNAADQCDGNGNCVDCVNNGGCGECCVCNTDHHCFMAN
jgi:hypothetical protein